MSTPNGVLIELIARGKKDAYFQTSTNPQYSFFHAVYPRRTEFTQEVRLLVPRNKALWGKYVDFELEPIGDLMRDVYLRIDLPSWLPADVAAANPTGLVYDGSNVTYGYTNGVGAYVCEKIQLFCDQALIMETWGEYLSWRLGQTLTNTHVGILSEQAGYHVGTPLFIGRNATPKYLRVPIPIPGQSHGETTGLPLWLASGQRFWLRVHLRNLNEIVEASNGALNPTPWNSKTFKIQETKTSEIREFKTLPEYQIGAPVLYLETTQVYLPKAVKELMRVSPIRIPFMSTQQNLMTIEEQKWGAAQGGGPVSLSYELAFSGAVSRIALAFQNEANRQAGQLYTYKPIGANAFIQNIRMQLNNEDRIQLFDTDTWKYMGNYWKNRRNPMLAGAYPDSRGVQNREIYTFSFGSNGYLQPEATLNFSGKIKPLLTFQLAPIPADPRLSYRRVHMKVYAEVWNVLEFRNQKVSLIFAY